MEELDSSDRPIDDNGDHTSANHGVRIYSRTSLAPSPTLDGPLDGQRLHHRYFEDGMFARIHTLADGSCFFHSLACALNYQNFSASSRLEQTRIGRELRSKIFTEARYAAFIETIDESLREMCDENGSRLIPTLEQAQCYNYHATDPLWRMTAQVLGLTICVVETPKTFYVTNVDSDIRACVLIGWIDRCHFEPIISLDGATTATAAEDDVLNQTRQVLDNDAYIGAVDGENRVGVFDINAPVVQRFLGRKKRSGQHK